MQTYIAMVTFHPRFMTHGFTENLEFYLSCKKKKKKNPPLALAFCLISQILLSNLPLVIPCFLWQYGLQEKAR